MKNKYFNKNENRYCSCCINGMVSDYIDFVFCKKKGIMDKTDSCRHFKYDVLKRIPADNSPKKNYKREDFLID